MHQRYVYIAAGPNGLYKIGQSADPAKRVKGLAKATAGVSLMLSVPTTEPTALEFFLHGAFAHCRVRGEWFRLSVGEIVAIRALKARPHSWRPPELVEAYARNRTNDFKWGGEEESADFDFLGRISRKAEPNGPIRLPQRLARRVRVIAAHRRMDPADYLAELLSPLIHADEGAMLADIAVERSDAAALTK